MKCVIRDGKQHLHWIKSDKSAPTTYFTYLPKFGKIFQEEKKGIVFASPHFLCGLFGDPASIKFDEMKKVLEGLSSKPLKVTKLDKTNYVDKSLGKKAPKIEAKGVLLFLIIGENMDMAKMAELFQTNAIAEMAE